MKFIGLLAAALLSVSALPTDSDSSESYHSYSENGHSLVHIVRKPTMADYRLLYDLLKNHIDDNSDNLPHWGTLLLM